MASVYAFAPSVIVMDEPSANLDPMATKKLREIIQALRSDGFTVVISEHRTHYIIDLVDRALLIQDGKLVREYQKSAFQSLTNAEANAMGLRSFYLDELQVPKHPLTKLNTVALELEQVTAGYTVQHPVIRNLNLKVFQGEILVLLDTTVLVKALCWKQFVDCKKNNLGS